MALPNTQGWKRANPPAYTPFWHPTTQEQTHIKHISIEQLQHISHLFQPQGHSHADTYVSDKPFTYISSGGVTSSVFGSLWELSMERISRLKIQTVFWHPRIYVNTSTGRTNTWVGGTTSVSVPPAQIPPSVAQPALHKAAPHLSRCRMRRKAVFDTSRYMLIHASLDSTLRFSGADVRGCAAAAGRGCRGGRGAVCAVADQRGYRRQRRHQVRGRTPEEEAGAHQHSSPHPCMCLPCTLHRPLCVGLCCSCSSDYGCS